MYTIKFRAMGSQVTAFLDTPSAQAAEVLADVPDWFEDWEQTLSRFRTDSELSQLNRSQGAPMRSARPYGRSSSWQYRPLNGAQAW